MSKENIKPSDLQSISALSGHDLQTVLDVIFALNIRGYELKQKPDGHKCKCQGCA